ncbi:SDR family NAD(P)-dependent oxidoreductase [Leucobacter tenebrionis]|uniref:SDR family NAD(P)-dependent oxidoreductase n=1 Tax=Leucobacter tenebrionis TaxID=2873270 RepID=UPI001CA69492|nr:SDR family NAD(P)-dependent oxidoreductase [Leucobacter tenebrionis]QZY50780.1 SDR family oxidoreductase [Leucobacter tenebrionis]
MISEDVKTVRNGAQDDRKRWVFVTGGASGIGEGIARVLHDSGYGVILADRDAERLAEVSASFEHVRTVVADVSDPAATAVMRDAAESVDGLWGLVNAAGISMVKHFLLNTEEEWTRILRVNLEGTFRSIGAIAPVLKNNGGGAIVNIASITGRAPAALQAAYAASKAGVIGMSKSLAFDFGPLDITVNAVCPGVVRTPIWDRILEQDAAATGRSEDEIFAEHVKPIPVGRPQSVQDIGEISRFLLSDAARSISGEEIGVTGGMGFVEFDFATAARELPEQL